MEAILQFFFPVFCAGCRKCDSTGLCDSCRRKIVPGSFPHVTGISNGVVLGLYSSPLVELIKDLKYGHVRAAGETLGKMLSGSLLETGWKVDFVVCAPMHPGRARSRGYNPAAVLAGSLAQKLGYPWGDSLRVIRPIRHQVGLGRKERTANVRGAFSLKDPANFAGKNVLVVDDVVTTGSTFSECARALSGAGASRIYGAAAASEPLKP